MLKFAIATWNFICYISKQTYTGQYLSLAIVDWSLNPIHLRVKMTKMLRQSWYPGNFFPRTKTMPALLNNQRRSAVLQCLCFATGTRKWPRFVRMFKALLSFTTINLTATEIFFMVIPFSLMTPKEDAAQNVPNTQVNFLLLCHILGSSILNVLGGTGLIDHPCLAQPVELKQLNNTGPPLQRRSERCTKPYSKHPAPYTHSHFPTCVSSTLKDEQH